MKIKPLRLSVTNCFLVKAKDRYILVDTGYEDEWSLFRKRLDERGVELSQVSHIILTHHNNDHSGLLHNITLENNSVQVVTSHLSKEFLLNGENDHTHGERFLSRRIALLITLGLAPLISLRLKMPILLEKLDTFPPYHLRGCDTLVVGDTRLRDIGIPLDGRIIETPGHTIDSISVLFDDGDCLIGDTAANVFALQALGAKYCPHIVTDMDTLYRSWEKIIVAGAQKLYPAHGCPFSIGKLKTNLWKHEPEGMNRSTCTDGTSD